MRSIPIIIAVAACHHAEEPERTVHPKAITVTGTVDGAAIAFTCMNPGHDILADTTATPVGGGAVLVACQDAKSGINANATVLPTIAKQTLLGDESNGRITLNFPAPDGTVATQITTSTFGIPDATIAQGTTLVTLWDPGAGEIRGTATQTWTRDHHGKAGSLTIAFDVTLQ